MLALTTNQNARNGLEHIYMPINSGEQHVTVCIVPIGAFVCHPVLVKSLSFSSQDVA